MYEKFKEECKKIISGLTVEARQKIVKDGEILLSADKDTNFISEDNKIFHNLCKEPLKDV